MADRLKAESWTVKREGARKITGGLTYVFRKRESRWGPGTNHADRETGKLKKDRVRGENPWSSWERASSSTPIPEERLNIDRHREKRTRRRRRDC